MTLPDIEAKMKEIKEAMQERLNFLVSDDAVLQKMQGQLDGITFMEGNRNGTTEAGNSKTG